MKKLKKINLNLNKEVISSLSGNEMNHVKGGTNLSNNPNVICTGTNPLSVNGNSCPEPATRNDYTCVVNVCEIQPATQTCEENNTCRICWQATVAIYNTCSVIVC